MATGISMVSPSRSTVRSTEEPACARMSDEVSSKLPTGSPSKATMRSPGWMPALAAAEPSTTERTCHLVDDG